MVETPSQEVLEQIDSLLRDHSLNEVDIVMENLNKEKHRISAQLKVEGESRLQDFETAVDKMRGTIKGLQELKLYMGKLDKLQKVNNSGRSSSFKVFDAAIIAINNISAVENIKEQVDNFERDKIYVKQLIDEELSLLDLDLQDDGDRFIKSNGNSFLIAHYQLNKLMDFGDQLRSKQCKVSTSIDMINEISADIEKLSSKFDSLLENVVDNIYELYLSGNFEYLIKTCKVIEYEEKEDLKVKVWKSLVDDNDAINEPLGANNKLTRTKERGYKVKFRDMIKTTIQDKIIMLTDDEKHPYKACQIVVNKMLPNNSNDPVAQANANSYYDILTVYREAARQCSPPQWKLFSNILEWCQSVIRNVFVQVLESNAYTDDLIGKMIHLNLDNRSRLVKSMGIPSGVIKNLSFLPEDKKSFVLSERLNTRESDLKQHVQNLLKRDITKFNEICANGTSGINEGVLLNVASPLINLLKSHFALIYQLHDESINIEFLSYFANEVLKTYCEVWSNSIMTTYQKFINVDGSEGNVPFYPEQLSILAVYFSKLADELEIKLEISNLNANDQSEGILLQNLDAIFYNDSSRERILEITDSSIKNAIDITVVCLSTYAKATVHDADTLFDEVFSKDWYNNSAVIDKILELITQNSLEPFEQVIDKHSNEPDEVKHGLLDKLIDEIILRYLQSLNNRNKVSKKIDVAIQRDIGKFNKFLKAHSSDVNAYDNEVNDNEGIKFIVLEYVETLLMNNNYEQIWVEIMDSIPQMPLDLLRVILESKKEKNIDSIVSLCESISSKVVSSGNKEFDFLRRFMYVGKRK